MLNRIFAVDSVTLTTSGSAVSTHVPFDMSARKLPTQVVLRATGNGAYVRLSDDQSAATSVDMLVQAGDHAVVSVLGRHWVSVLNVSGSSTVNIEALSTGVSGEVSFKTWEFAGSTTLDPSITFTRASSGSYYDSTGILRSAATNVPRLDYDPSTLQPLGLLIEEARTNLFTYSEDFLNTATAGSTRPWGWTNTTVTVDATTSPANNSTADALFETSATGAHDLTTANTITGTAASTNYVQSIFVKANGRTTIWLFDNAGSSVTQHDLTGSGASAVVGGTVTVHATQNMGNGWYRCIRGGVTNASGNASPSLRLINSLNNSSYTGDPTQGVYVWGAQAELGAFATSYVPSTNTFISRATTGTFYGSNGLIQTAAINVARYNYNPANLTIAPTLLLEAAATNLLTYSGNVAGTNWTVQAGITVSLNNAVSPDNTTTATLLTGVTANAVYQAATLATSTSYSLSIFAKVGTSTRSSLGLFDVTAGSFKGRLFIAWSAGVPSTFSSSGCTNITYTPLPNGWYRVSITVVSDAVNTSHRLYFYPDSIAANGTLSVWGAQLEAGSGATSYIPTVASQVTRDADISSSAAATRARDIASIATLTPWYNTIEGTFAVKFQTKFTANADITRYILLSDASANKRIAYISAGSSQAGTYDGITLISATGNVVSSASKVASTYSATARSICANGNAVSSGTVAAGYAATSSINLMSTGNELCGWFSYVSYYPRRLSNTELQSLTT